MSDQKERRKVKRPGRSEDVACELHKDYLDRRFDATDKMLEDYQGSVRHEMSTVRGDISAYRYRIEETIKEDVIPLREAVFHDGLSELPKKIEKMTEDQRKRGLVIMVAVVGLIASVVGGMFFLGRILGKVEQAVENNTSAIMRVEDKVEAHDSWGREQQEENLKKFQEQRVDL